MANLRLVDCYTKHDAESCEGESGGVSVYFNMTCYNSSQLADYDDYTSCSNVSVTASYNSSCTPYNWLLDQIKRRVSASEEYFKYVKQARLFSHSIIAKLDMTKDVSVLVSWWCSG